MSAFESPSFTIAFALAAGVVALGLATHLRVPGLVLLLLCGVVLGPDVLDVVRPASLGDSLQVLVGFAVAVILFEGGLGLDLGRLRKEQRAIRQLVTIGALVTAAGSAVAAYLALGWTVRISLLFGTLVIVTGPTVITPLLRRLKLKSDVATILEAEGVLIDAIGAIIAAVALEVALRPTGESIALGAFDIALRLGIGTIWGLVGGGAIALPLKRAGLIPEGHQNIFTLGMVLALYQGANAMVHESGIAAVIVAGIVVRNAKTPVDRELREFKEQLTMMFIGLLFVLLAADVRVADVIALGWGGIAVVAALMFIVRPLNVLVGTWRAGLDWRRRVFVAWIGPRGIVAAAIASLFVGELERAGIEGGRAMRAMVFLVITATVVWAGVTGGLVASWLGLRRKRDSGWVILGAGTLARTLAKLFVEAGEEVVCIETNPRSVQKAEQAGLRVIFGNAMQTTILRRAEIEARAGAIGLTPNEDANVLFLQRVKAMAGHLRLYAALSSLDTGFTASMVHKTGGHVMFGGAENVERWSRRLDDDAAAVSWWRRAGDQGDALVTGAEGNAPYLALLHRHDGAPLPVSARTKLEDGVEVAILIDLARREEAVRRLEELHYQLVSPDESRIIGPAAPEAT